MNLPSAGLDGSYRGSCIVCLGPTDTVLGFEGSPEWLVAAMMRLGIPEREAAAMVDTAIRTPRGLPKYSRVRYQVCSDCVAKEPAFPVPVLYTSEVVPYVALGGAV